MPFAATLKRLSADVAEVSVQLSVRLKPRDTRMLGEFQEDSGGRLDGLQCYFATVCSIIRASWRFSCLDLNSFPHSRFFPTSDTRNTLFLASFFSDCFRGAHLENLFATDPSFKPFSHRSLVSVPLPQIEAPPDPPLMSSPLPSPLRPGSVSNLPRHHSVTFPVIFPASPRSHLSHTRVMGTHSCSSGPRRRSPASACLLMPMERKEIGGKIGPHLKQSSASLSASVAVGWWSPLVKKVGHSVQACWASSVHPGLPRRTAKCQIQSGIKRTGVRF